MTRFILAVALAGLVGVARAGDFAQPIIFGVTSTMTVTNIAITTQTATDVIISTRPLYRQVCIQNLDTTAFVVCAESSVISTMTTSMNMGVYLTTATAASLSVPPPCFEVVPGNRFWCQSASLTNASRVITIRKR